MRVFQDFATLDLLSHGRAEIMAGRGSFIESFPLFGYDLRDYDALFQEKLELLLQLRVVERVTWTGRHRASLQDLGVYPRPFQAQLPIWVAVGGTPESVVRAATLGLPLALAIIGGMPERFAPLVHLYRETAQRAGHDPAQVARKYQLAWVHRRRFPPSRRHLLSVGDGVDEQDRPRTGVVACHAPTT